ncbi:hypothetical protein K2173_012991 [Erythroxylum novogranatense]|uniref:Hydroxyproline-rich glycoprotein family protein n=1 Tax=Erythroxylum novogranatense TaxID=1862640 RepID=A0AAV8S7K3_9ROSI|nr:hypothetical protein K2173_012991 [Erythroxylum novogranatense]
MADASYYTKDQQRNRAKPSKFYTHFLYKALIVSIFLVILPLFPSQAPDFINQTLKTRGWEFLHLLFVGIAVSYGLFSRRNEETEKENNNTNLHSSKFDSAQSYVSTFLQVSSVFDDESDSPPRSDGNKVQTWNSQYCRNEPVVVVTEEHPVVDEDRGNLTSSRIAEKPLLLPVRSLKTRVIDENVNERRKDSVGVSGSLSRSGSKRFTSKGGGFGGLDHQELAEKLKDNVVLPSPIPWRSRSGRMEMKESDNPLNSIYSSEESEFNRSSRAQVSRSPATNSTNSSPKLSSSSSLSSPKKLSPATSFSVEAQGKMSPPPPPPPPLPPLSHVIRSSSSMKPTSVAVGDHDFKRSLSSETKDLNRRPTISLTQSVRTTRSNETLVGQWQDRGFNNGITGKAKKMSKEVEPGSDRSPLKTEKPSHGRVPYMPQPSFRKFADEENQEIVESLVMESYEDSETEPEVEEDVIAGNSLVSGAAARTRNEEEAVSGGAGDVGPDVDKKADEFIAKFREQIRLQRIESIKRSSAQISKKNPK